MGKISSYGTASAPSLGDKLIGTSVGGNPVNGTYNFTIQQLADLISGQVNLQEVLNTGNTATQTINLTGTINATSLFTTNSVGVGTATVASKLHVAGTFRNVLTPGIGGQTILSAIDGISNGYLITVDTSNNITHRWNTGANETSLYIAASGNVGIKNESPTQNLTVGVLASGIKRIYVPGTYNFDGAYLSNFDENGGGKLELVAHTSSLNSSSWRISHSNDIYPQALIFSRAVGVSSYGALVYSTPSMMINNIGNIGMGIASDSNFALSIKPNGNSGITNGIKLYEVVNDWSWGITNTSDDGDFVITDTEYSSSTRFHIQKQTGIVTIGSAPLNSALLNVRGDGYFTKNGGGNITINSESFGNSKLTLLSNSSGSKKAFIDAPLAAGTLVFQTQSTDRMFIDSFGSVIINNSISIDTNYKFQVTGDSLFNGYTRFEGPIVSTVGLIEGVDNLSIATYNSTFGQFIYADGALVFTGNVAVNMPYLTSIPSTTYGDLYVDGNGFVRMVI